MHNFKELKVWKAGIEISKLTFQLTRSFPSEEKYGLVSQMTRSAISIPSNIAEGCGRKSNKEFYQFLNIALGSSFELETQLIIAKEFNYIDQEKLDTTCALIIDIQKMINGLQKSLNT
jgi:four helix bundle protein